MTLDPKTEVELSNVLAEARTSVKNLENTTKRIHNIVNEPMIPKSRKTPREKDSQAPTISVKFATFISIAAIVLLGMFGVIFLQYTSFTSGELRELNQRISKMEATNQEKPVTPPSHNEVK